MRAERPRLRRLPAALAVLCGLAVLVVVAWPDAWAVNRAVVRLYLVGLNHLGLPPSITPEHWHAVLNVLLFAPGVACLALALPRVPWWCFVLGALGLSVLVELVQGASGLRHEDPADVLTNTAGAVLGVLAARVVERWLASRGTRAGT